MTDETLSAPGQQPLPPGPNEPFHDIGDPGKALIDSGLLWAINEFVLHGRGYEIVVLSNGHLGIRGDGGSYREWRIDPDAIDGAMRRFRQALLDAQAANKLVRAPSTHSPGFRTVGRQTRSGPA